MQLVLNAGVRNITVVLPSLKAGAAVKRIGFAPGMLTPVEAKDWDRAKQVKLVKRLLDEGELMTGAKAAKKANTLGVTTALKDQEKAAQEAKLAEAIKQAEGGTATEDEKADDDLLDD